ncbi:DUF928 domain-containing protein [Pantanalinema sp. GBBB05]|uniref:DUF928 domain-containing protein n=1 Tax=Pantanalinema sp. GBBB05 TaxID=2604139 RepID=UPI001E02ECDA|nr:DUF928 domain-containing protein [Pantanalinema sp. GBBB05]
MVAKFVLSTLTLAISSLLPIVMSQAAPAPLLRSRVAQSLPSVPSGGGRPSGTIAGGSRFSPPPPPSDLGAPSSRSGGGASRGVCLGKEEIIALMPIYPQGRSSLVWGLTTVERPSFWFYVPPIAGSVAEMEFVLQDHTGKKIYQTKNPVTQSGVISVTLPANSPALTIDNRYQWYFKVRCPAAPSQLPKYVNGWIERQAIDTNLANQLQQVPPAQRAALYAQQGIWFDAITTLGQLRQTQPQDPALAKQWADLLDSVQLKDLATRPLIQ